MKEKGIKAEDVKNLPPIEEIHGLNIPPVEESHCLDNPTQVVKVNSLYRYDKDEIPSTKFPSQCLDEFDDFMARQENFNAYCNTPGVTFHICISNSCHFRRCDMLFPMWLGFVFCFSFYSCHAYHIMSSCAFHFAYVFVSCIRAFSPLSVSQSDTPTCTGAPLLSLFVCGC